MKIRVKVLLLLGVIEVSSPLIVADDRPPIAASAQTPVAAAAPVSAQTTPPTSDDENVITLMPDYSWIFVPYDRAIERNPKNAQAYIDRARVESIQGDQRNTDRALADYSQAIALKPDFADAYLARGWVKRQKHDYKGAKADFDKVFELSPKSADAYAQHGDLLGMAIGDFDGAIADYSQAIVLDPNQAKFYYERGHFESGKADVSTCEKADFEAAIADFSKAIQLNPSDSSAYFFRGLTYCYLGHFDRAIADYDNAVKLHPSCPLDERGLAKFAKGDLDGAIADFSKEKNCFLCDVYRADVEQAKGNFEAAINDYVKSIQSSRIQPMDQCHLFLTLRRLHLDVSPAGLNMATIRNGKDPWFKTVVLYLTGALTEAEFLTQVEPSAKMRIAEWRPRSTPHGFALHMEDFKCQGFYYVGMMHLLANDPETAEQFFKKCLAAPLPFDTESLLARAELARLQAKN
jgi:tetratricopeptide (TPR) repeat protein